MEGPFKPKPEGVARKSSSLLLTGLPRRQEQSVKIWNWCSGATYRESLTNATVRCASSSRSTGKRGITLKATWKEWLSCDKDLFLRNSYEAKQEFLPCAYSLLSPVEFWDSFS